MLSKADKEKLEELESEAVQYFPDTDYVSFDFASDHITIDASLSIDTLIGLGEIAAKAKAILGKDE